MQSCLGSRPCWQAGAVAQQQVRFPDMRGYCWYIHCWLALLPGGTLHCAVRMQGHVQRPSAAEQEQGSTCSCSTALLFLQRLLLLYSTAPAAPAWCAAAVGAPPDSWACTSWSRYWLSWYKLSCMLASTAAAAVMTLLLRVACAGGDWDCCWGMWERGWHCRGRTRGLKHGRLWWGAAGGQHLPLVLAAAVVSMSGRHTSTWNVYGTRCSTYSACNECAAVAASYPTAACTLQALRWPGDRCSGVCVSCNIYNVLSNCGCFR
jgi:hypothetical protein